MIPYGHDYTCDHGEPPGWCRARGCPHNDDAAADSRDASPWADPWAEPPPPEPDAVLAKVIPFPMHRRRR
ncbi:MAG TPA: hypothetical protein VFB74_15135 [Kribbellaceae bacterium]|nr:hypothetical protein [Kribbellaceae bacterium]